MADLMTLRANLNPIHLMSRENLISHILKIRNARRFVPKATIQKSGPAAKGTKSNLDSKALLDKLTPEQAEALLAKLEG